MLVAPDPPVWLKCHFTAPCLSAWRPAAYRPRPEGWVSSRPFTRAASRPRCWREGSSAVTKGVRSCSGGVSWMRRWARGRPRFMLSCGFSSKASSSRVMVTATAPSVASSASLANSMCSTLAATPAARSSSSPLFTAGLWARGTSSSSTRLTASTLCLPLEGFTAAVSGSSSGWTQKVGMDGPRLAALATRRTSAQRITRLSLSAALDSRRRT
ncbi:hypothetical protein V8C86DRAFT_2593924 [Haematococcus lacustris]